MINDNLNNIFNRSGLGALSDLKTTEYKSIFAQLEKEQEAFLDKENEFRSAEYKWPRDPLHEWSRAWEYPYVYNHLATYINSLHPNSRPVAADVGSGVTFFPFALAKMGYHVVCTDIDPICEKDLDLASKCIPHQPGKIDFRLIEMSNMPFNDSECDVVYCISVLEHVADIKNTVMEITRILKPDGLCIITCDINIQPLSHAQLDIRRYKILLSELGKHFKRIYPDITIHPMDILTMANSPYAKVKHSIHLMNIVWQLTKQKIIKPILWKKPGKVNFSKQNLAVLGLALKK